MLTCSGCRLVTDWEDIEACHFNIVMVATKTHWLARIAHEMNNFRWAIIRSKEGDEGWFTGRLAF